MEVHGLYLQGRSIIIVLGIVTINCNTVLIMVCLHVSLKSRGLNFSVKKPAAKMKAFKEPKQKKLIAFLKKIAFVYYPSQHLRGQTELNKMSGCSDSLIRK